MGEEGGGNYCKDFYHTSIPWIKLPTTLYAWQVQVILQDYLGDHLLSQAPMADPAGRPSMVATLGQGTDFGGTIMPCIIAQLQH